jgi:hypothetical protein
MPKNNKLSDLPQWDRNKANEGALRQAIKIKGASDEQIKGIVSSYMEAIGGIDKLATFIRDSGYILVTGPGYENTTVCGKDYIQINSRPSPIRQLIVLSHEIGHMIINETPYYDRKFSKGYGTTGVKGRNLIYMITVLREEIEAWDIGIKKCEELNIHLDMELLDDIRARCIKTYANWVAGKKNKNGQMGQVIEDPIKGKSLGY